MERNDGRVKPDVLNLVDGWYAGGSEEYMNIGGPFATREEAIAEGRHDRGGDPFYICFAGLMPWSAPDATSVIDRWTEDHDELWWEDGFPGFDGPDAEGREAAAEADLQRVLNEWFQRHKDMLPTPTAFAVHHSGEWIDTPTPTTPENNDG